VETSLRDSSSLCLPPARGWRASAVLTLLTAIAVAWDGYAPPTASASAPFRRGDVDSDGELSLTDAVSILEYLFLGKGGEDVCEDAADTNDSGRVDLADAVFLLVHLFAGGAPLPEPAEFCGEDPTDDALGCATYACPEFGSHLVDGAEAVVLVIDRSEQMETSGQLNVAKRQAIAFMWAIASRAEAAVVFSDRHELTIADGDQLYIAAEKEKELLVRSVVEAEPGYGACPQEALLAGLDLLQRSKRVAKTLIFLSNGFGTCHGSAAEAQYHQETLDAVADRNVDRVTIHAVGILDVGPLQEQFMLGLATENGGLYEVISR
ncbi:MAG TPA: hypothetical protein VFD71_10570, partial [Planctomycetota bacterium]|nr:hypothetical protein [Planctomycetota bacterium]